MCGTGRRAWLAGVIAGTMLTLAPASAGELYDEVEMWISAGEENFTVGISFYLRKGKMYLTFDDAVLVNEKKNPATFKDQEEGDECKDFKLPRAKTIFGSLPSSTGWQCFNVTQMEPGEWRIEATMEQTYRDKRQFSKDVKFDVIYADHKCRIENFSGSTTRDGKLEFWRGKTGELKCLAGGVMADWAIEDLDKQYNVRR
ncbi:hypothetical protein [Ancylobacter sp. TS-1]|uniref:hypothetical protein n=1 Tax=Ancylobacter sp. TS-1 TaxID=1850374 RepID=UPI001265BB20|nr:hypothetical protein [Ancylobacter sp. TS-1]QFR32702.1 hypothetical protein GBB76_05935 [Ancylobacter sp. TS-1]